ncbi:hypothetical protein B0H34DRAFT_727221 [Crassisporium funariophilum]|nr:hypothetical protein B0H34DRAFT_727221 [Crassisporium funariophilum]
MGGGGGGRKGRSPYLQHDSYDAPPPLPVLVPEGRGGGAVGFLARHSIIPKRSFSASQSSIWGGSSAAGDHQQQQPAAQQQSPMNPNTISSTRLTRLSNVDEHELDSTTPRAASKTHQAQSRLSRTGASPSRPSSSKDQKTGSVRSMPPQLLVASASAPLPGAAAAAAGQGMPLAMTPENIKPLLENAKEVHARLDECIEEIRALIQVGFAGGGGGGGGVGIGAGRSSVDLVRG